MVTVELRDVIVLSVFDAVCGDEKANFGVFGMPSRLFVTLLRM